jgi:bisanhydrobacterioruberin hydratase
MLLVAGNVVHFIKYTLFKTEKRKALGVAYFYVMGIIFHAVPFIRPYVMLITPYFLLIFGALVFSFVAREKSRSVLIWSAGTYLLTFAVEAVGVKTGVIFGPYYYGTVLGPKLLEVPVIIGFNWLLVIIGLAVVSGKICKSPFLAAGIVGAGAFLFDFILEPIAIRLSYWTWAETAVPIRNYIAWFLIAYCAALVYHLLKMKIKTLLPVYYLGIQTGFFIILRFVL